MRAREQTVFFLLFCYFSVADRIPVFAGPVAKIDRDFTSRKQTFDQSQLFSESI
jgi:hypothetical protein